MLDLGQTEIITQIDFRPQTREALLLALCQRIDVFDEVILNNSDKDSNLELSSLSTPMNIKNEVALLSRILKNGDITDGLMGLRSAIYIIENKDITKIAPDTVYNFIDALIENSDNKLRFGIWLYTLYKISSTLGKSLVKSPFDPAIPVFLKLSELPSKLHYEGDESEVITTLLLLTTIRIYDYQNLLRAPIESFNLQITGKLGEILTGITNPECQREIYKALFTTFKKSIHELKAKIPTLKEWSLKEEDILKIQKEYL
ncbi:hypothetical protein IT417_00140 [bacterium]|nr:hypothetical protein [bacterium]